MDGYYAWMLVATSLVLMMTTPALALFYGGMSRSKSVLNRFNDEDRLGLETLAALWVESSDHP